MNHGKYIFAQIIEFLPQRIFDKYVKKYNGNRYIKHFSCWNQLLCMIFGQLSNRDSLRDLIIVISAHKTKAYHLGFGKNVTRSNLAKANLNRDSKMFEEYAYYLVGIARTNVTDKEFKFKGQAYAFDSSTIDLCLAVFWWAKFRKKKGGIKLHTLFDINTQIPTFVHITNASVHDVNAMDYLGYESGAYYIFDRGYVDYARLFKITRHNAYFVIRAKSNMKFKRMYSSKKEKSTGVKCDQVGKLSGFYVSKDYPVKIRRIKFFDKETNRIFIFLTNNFELSAEQVAFLYKNRWKVELFFKWIKQHLKIKSFWGTSENAVRIQIYSAIIAYCLVAIVRNSLKIKVSTYEMLQILSSSLFDKTPIKELLTNVNYNDVKEPDAKQLSLKLF